MSNWDLMMPGMGLTSIGLAGLVLSYAEIAHTFIDGMHALTGLTMFVGLIFLAAGILDGGVSTSNRAKATVLVILSISLGFGMFAFTFNTSNYTVVIAGVLMAIAFPSIIISYMAMKHPRYLKPVGTITGLAAATGIIAWVAFGFVSPDTYIIPQQAPAEEIEDIPDVFTFPITILEGSSEEQSPHYEPDVAVVEKGSLIEWNNADSVEHTVTSSSDAGETFDSGLLAAGETFALDTANMEPGTYEYSCLVHPWMTSTVTIEGPAEPVIVVIPDGAGAVQPDQIYYDPESLDVTAGTVVVWDNLDSVAHTVSSGSPQAGPTSLFDSGLFAPGATYEFVFEDPGSYEYYCLVHPWMVGTVNVE